MTLYIHYLSDHPNYLICSYKAASLLGHEILGMLTLADSYCPDWHAYAVDDDKWPTTPRVAKTEEWECRLGIYDHGMLGYWPVIRKVQ